MPSTLDLAALIPTQSTPPGGKSPVRPRPADAATATTTATRPDQASLGQLLLLSDGLAGLLALLLAPSGSLLALPVAVLTSVMLADSDLYRGRLRLSVLDDAAQVWLRGLAASSAAGTALLLLGRTAEGTAALLCGTTFVLLALLGRALTYHVVGRQRLTGSRSDRGLVVGVGDTGRQLAGALVSRRRLGVRPVAFVDVAPPRRVDGLPAFALHADAAPTALAALASQLGVSAIFVTPSALTDEQVTASLRGCDRLECEVFVVPQLHELGMWRSHIEEVVGLPLVRLRRAAHRSMAWRAKRVFDVVVAGTGLVLTSPLLALCAVGAHLDGGPGVLFRQVRVGRDGAPFTVLKIRSLRPLDETESATQWDVEGDPRLSPFGRALRRSSLDELPQLWNIVRGDMSLVGPRPERPHFVARFSSDLPHYGSRGRVPVGLTGWAQVNGLRGNTSISDRARYDNQYIDNWSLWLDARILLQTVAHLLRGTRP